MKTQKHKAVFLNSSKAFDEVNRVILLFTLIKRNKSTYLVVIKELSLSKLNTTCKR